MFLASRQVEPHLKQFLCPLKEPHFFHREHSSNRVALIRRHIVELQHAAGHYVLLIQSTFHRYWRVWVLWTTWDTYRLSLLPHSSATLKHFQNQFKQERFSAGLRKFPNCLLSTSQTAHWDEKYYVVASVTVSILAHKKFWNLNERVNVQCTCNVGVTNRIPGYRRIMKASWVYTILHCLWFLAVLKDRCLEQEIRSWKTSSWTQDTLAWTASALLWAMTTDGIE